MCQWADTERKVTQSSLNEEETAGRSLWILCVILAVDIIGKNRNRDSVGVELCPEC